MNEIAPHRLALAEALADAFLDGRWRAEDLAERGAGRLGSWPGWLDGLAFAVAARDRVTPVGDRGGLLRFIANYLEHRSLTAPTQPMNGTPAGRRFTPLPVARHWAVTRIESVPALAERLELSGGQLAWLADVRGWERTAETERLRNYRYRWVPRRSGVPRLIEAPKARLKEIQRWVLHEILDHVPVHDGAHGFTRGRSVLTHAATHTEQAIVLRLDLSDFFASVSAGRVYGLFRALGYDHAVAHALTGLCTNSIPVGVWDAAARPAELRLIQRHFWLGRQLATPHLPQGAPTSPALANLATFGLDRRLTALAAGYQLRYSRYADDLTFSGPRLTAGANRTLLALAGEIVTDEGFAVNRDKTSLRTSAQRQLVTGVVVNAHANIPRPEYDRLRAVLHRVARDGPAAHRPDRPVDLHAHLRGQVAWVTAVNRRRGAKLQRLLDAIDWTRIDDTGA